MIRRLSDTKARLGDLSQRSRLARLLHFRSYSFIYSIHETSASATSFGSNIIPANLPLFENQPATPLSLGFLAAWLPKHGTTFRRYRAWTAKIPHFNSCQVNKNNDSDIFISSPPTKSLCTSPWLPAQMIHDKRVGSDAGSLLLSM